MFTTSFNDNDHDNNYTEEVTIKTTTESEIDVASDAVQDMLMSSSKSSQEGTGNDLFSSKSLILLLGSCLFLLFVLSIFLTALYYRYDVEIEFQITKIV